MHHFTIGVTTATFERTFSNVFRLAESKLIPRKTGVFPGQIFNFGRSNNNFGRSNDAL